MLNCKFAATWIPFAYESHMRRVQRGDLIFMYANGQGVIQVGRAEESRLEILGPHNGDRLRSFEHGGHEEEWRIPVEWLVRDETPPCPIQEPLRGAFLQMKSNKRLRKIKRHFLREVPDD
jgi:hypothetical protein